MHATLNAQAEVLDRHSELLRTIKGSGDFLHLEVAKVANVQVGTRGTQEKPTTGAQEAHVMCNSLHGDCARLTRELQSRDSQIADAMERCHVMASANTAALHLIAESVQEVRAQASPTLPSQQASAATLVSHALS
jgi:hypothetical protein